MAGFRAARIIVGIAAAAWIVACGGGNSNGENPSPTPSGVATIGRDGGKVVAESAEVVVPPGAMDGQTTLRVAADSGGSPPLPNWVQVAGEMIAITPHGGAFNEPVTVRLRAPNAPLAANERLYIAKADPGGPWQVLSETMQRDGWLEAQVSSFSYFVPVIVPFTTTTATGLTNLTPFALTPLVLSCDGVPCGNPERARSMTLTIATSGNGGPLPQNCGGSQVRLWLDYRPAANFRDPAGGPYPATPGVSIRSDIAFPLGIPNLGTSTSGVQFKVVAELTCTDPGTNASSTLTLGSVQVNVDSFGDPFPTVVDFPTTLNAAVGDPINLRAVLKGRGSAPTATDQATVYLERAGPASSGWVTVATWQETAANPLPYAGAPAWRYFSFEHLLGPVTSADNGTPYRVRSCFGNICELSRVVILSVSPIKVAPQITQQPTSMLIQAGQTASLSARASGTTDLQWQTRPPGTTGDWSNVTDGSGGTTGDYTTPVLQLADSGVQYRMVAVGLSPLLKATSNPVTVTVSGTAVAPTITSQPTPLTVVEGSEAVFAVAASGTAPLSYQWYLGNSILLSANGPQLRLPAVSSVNAADYSVRVSNTVGAVQSNAARLTVSALPVPPPVAPSIVTQPAAVAVGEGNTATFAVGVAGSGPLTFQWRHNGTVIAGATAAAYTIPAVAAADAGNYSVIVGNGAGSAASQAATLAIVSGGGGSVPTAPTIVAPPSSVVVAPGMSAAFGVTAQGSGPLNYRWFRNEVEVTGQTAAVYVISAATALDAGGYRVEVSNAAGTAASPTSQVILLGAPVITTLPASTSIPEGDKATFIVSATGDALRYQWTRNGVAIDGATGAGYTTPALALGDGGAVFSVVVYNGAGAVVSPGALLTVTAAPPPPPPAATASRIDAGFRHTCAVRSDGVATCWGYNSSGQIASGNFNNWTTPYAWSTLGEAVTSVGAGHGSSCALTASGKVYCAGTVAASQNRPVAIASIDGALQLAVGSGHACVLAADRTVWCWGGNGAGQLGNNSNLGSTTPVQVQGVTGLALGDVDSIAAGRDFNCAVLRDRSLVCWGNNATLQTGSPSGTDTRRAVTVAGLSAVVSVAPGTAHTCAALADGTARCWGYNGAGQLGNGTADTTSTEVPGTVVGLTDVVSLASAENSSCAIVAGGAVRCWGTASMGNGNGSETRTTPVTVSGLSGIVALAAGFDHTCALRGNATLACWGSGSEGQLGLGDTVARFTPTTLPGFSVLAP